MHIYYFTLPKSYFLTSADRRYVEGISIGDVNPLPTIRNVSVCKLIGTVSTGKGKKKRIFSELFSKPNYVLTGCVHTRQKLSEMAKSWILMTLGWVDILIRGVHHAKYF